jgi:hypothetical protein
MRLPWRLLTSRDASRSRGAKCLINVSLVPAEQLPELASRLPDKRKIWKSEDYRMSIFDAAALGVGYFTGRRPVTKRVDVSASQAA